jgi:crotonobetainyl-CoA:carnitine CoA-transferase CaiB-like acyl-CoA transferase
MTSPLDGVRVLDLSRLLPGPYCTLVLSDLGASVDKLEDPHAGDYLRVFPPQVAGLGMSGKFAALNRDKRSLCLDLKHPEGRAALLKILPRYDILVETFRPGVLDRLGLDTDTLLGAQPRLVVCAISGYDADGPYRDRAAHDLNTVGLAGVLGLAGPADGDPAVPPVQLADLGSGLVAATGILAALFDAQRTGRGRRVDVSMCESAFGFCVPVLGDLAAAGRLPPRGEELLTGGTAGYGVYRTKDDRFVTVAPLEPKFWEAFCHVLGRPVDAAALVAAPEEQAQVRAELQAIFSQHTRDEWALRFAGVDACVEPVLAPEELAGHPLHARRFVELDGVRYPQTALAGVGRRATHTTPPAQGAHSALILGEAGIADHEIAALRAAGVIR